MISLTLSLRQKSKLKSWIEIVSSIVSSCCLTQKYEKQKRIKVWNVCLGINEDNWWSIALRILTRSYFNIYAYIMNQDVLQCVCVCVLIHVSCKIWACDLIPLKIYIIDDHWCRSEKNYNLLSSLRKQLWVVQKAFFHFTKYKISSFSHHPFLKKLIFFVKRY